MNTLTVLASALLLLTQAPNAAAPIVNGGNLLLVTQNLEKSIEFYRDFVGLPYTNTTVPQFAPVTAGLADMYVARGGQMRNRTLAAPGSDLRLEMLEFRNIDASPVHPRLQDPGATILTFYVRDIDAVLARVEKNGVQVITPGGKPAMIEGGKARAFRALNTGKAQP